MFAPLVWANLGTEASPPLLQITRKPPHDMEAFGQALTARVRMGYKIGRRWAQGEDGIPEPDDDDELLVAPPEGQATLEALQS